MCAAEFGLYGEAGTLGAGGGLAVQLTDQFSLRAGYSTFTYNIKGYEVEDVVLDGEAKLGAGKLLLDWFPRGGRFRMGVGIVVNESGATGIARVSTDGYTINGTFYPSSQIATADGRVEFDSIAPYIGLGYGRVLDSSRRLSILVDVGVALTGAPTVSFVANCGTVPAEICTQIHEDVAAEEAVVQQDANALKILPNINIALSWRF